MNETELKPIIEALIYVAEEPITEASLVEMLGNEHRDLIRSVVMTLVDQYRLGQCGMEIKEIANGFKMATKPEYHEWVRKYVKQQTPPIRLSLAALETLAVIAYRQPITVPEIQEIRGVNAVGVLKTLIDKKLVTTSGRKNVIGRPILYRTTKEFLLQFGLKNLDELPSLEEFEELAQSAFGAAVIEEGGGMNAPPPAQALAASDGVGEESWTVQTEGPPCAQEAEAIIGTDSEVTVGNVFPESNAALDSSKGRPEEDTSASFQPGEPELTQQDQSVIDPKR